MGRMQLRGAAAAAGVVLGLALLPVASGAQATSAGHQRAHRRRTGVEWAGFAGNARHTAAARRRPQPFRRIRWRTKVDLAPNGAPIHYGSPMITAANTVLVPTRVSGKAGFRVVAYSGRSGTRRWSFNTDYRTPPFANGLFAWIPPLPAALTRRTTLAVAGAGGTVLIRRHVNAPSGPVRRLVFYGAARWHAHTAAFDEAVHITTPLTSAPDGSLYFGFTVRSEE